MNPTNFYSLAPASTRVLFGSTVPGFTGAAGSAVASISTKILEITNIMKEGGVTEEHPVVAKALQDLETAQLSVNAAIARLWNGGKGISN